MLDILVVKIGNYSGIRLLIVCIESENESKEYDVKTTLSGAVPQLLIWLWL
jgi:hypothetical protein